MQKKSQRRSGEYEVINTSHCRIYVTACGVILMISIYITDRDIISGEEGGDDSDPSLLGAHGDYATKSSVTFV